MSTKDLIQVVKEGLVRRHGYKDVMVIGIYHDQAIEFVGVKRNEEEYKGTAYILADNIIINEYQAGQLEHEGTKDLIPIHS